MNDLFLKMSADLRIERCKAESESEYICRICYSALGAWCLYYSQGNSIDVKGVSKKSVTIMLDTLINEYQCLEPLMAEYFKDSKHGECISRKIREMYEDVGCLITMPDSNRVTTSEYHYRVNTNTDKDLYLGILPIGSFEMNGLGVYVNKNDNALSVKDFIVRDDLNLGEYIESRYDICDFDEIDINLDELTFFDPYKKTAPSNAWVKGVQSDFSIARKAIFGPYYRVIRDRHGNLYYADEKHIDTERGLYSEEFRRLYSSLRAYYDNPIPVWINKVVGDDNYVKLVFASKLPSREYYYILMSAWPMGNVFGTREYLIKKEYVPIITEVLNAIGMDVKEF